MKIVTICGAGIGSSGILKVNAERVLKRLDILAEVTAADITTVAWAAEDAQVILTSAEFVEAIGKTYADVIVIDNFFDTDELTRKLRASLG
ncbi:MAG: ascorbate system component [Microbacteriaceae bacterium]|nr:ascorbate transporter subunit [Microbacteriaceae bacterium]MCU1505468.1 ascorbate transporter subunit [Microbacteriaceae bacterium]MDQ1525804.1 ascorbate system component [Microbacteriaceae bacterium]MDQ1550289.1 ascorbate system component [Microbacteriaceae bacterium]MDQ1579061.1 ascorbate system component [Microbacteriaceae bacterium]